MKLFFSLLLSFITFSTYSQETITSINDRRIPTEARSRIASLTDITTLEQFTYEIRYAEVDRKNPSISILKKIDLYFSDGKIKGEVRVTKSQVGYTSTTDANPVELCYMFCCTSKTSNAENCTENYKKFKEWEANPGCSNSRTTACKN